MKPERNETSNPRRWYRRGYGTPPLYGVSDLRFGARLNARDFELLRAAGCTPPPAFQFAGRPLWNPRSKDIEQWYQLVTSNRTGAGARAFEVPETWKVHPEPEPLIPITVVGAAAGFDGRNFYKAFDRGKVPPPDFVYGTILLYRNTSLLDSWTQMVYNTRGRRDRIASLPLWNDYIKGLHESCKES